jgi:hypothetical protein
MELSETSDILNYSIQALRKEIWVSTIYSMIARSYRSKDPKLADRLAELGIEEKAHATFWTNLLANRNQQITVTISPII